jgi:hypothetical protein
LPRQQKRTWRFFKRKFKGLMLNHSFESPFGFSN